MKHTLQKGQKRFQTDRKGKHFAIITQKTSKVIEFDNVTIELSSKNFKRLIALGVKVTNGQHLTGKATKTALTTKPRRKAKKSRHSRR